MKNRPYREPLFDRLCRAWNNWRNRKVGRAYRTLTAAMKADPYYASTWQANIAMPIYDGARGKLSHAEANEIANRLMHHLFEVEQNKRQLAA